jgi:hypothetical protein
MRRLAVIVLLIVLAATLVSALAAPSRTARESHPAYAQAAYMSARATDARGPDRTASRGTRAPGLAVFGPLIVGLNADVSGWGGASTAPRLDQVVSQTGAKWLREEFFWSRIEPRPGLFDFSYYDHFMLVAARRGEHILALLYDTPSWAGPADNAIPSDPTAFARFVAAVIHRYGPHGSFWAQYPGLAGSAIRVVELWNEPFAASGDDGAYDPPRYARLVKAAAIAARAADPTVDILLSAEMQSGRDSNGNWQWWVDALYQAVPDLNRYFDGVAMHDYGSDTTTLNPVIPGPPYPNYGHMLRIENLRHLFVNHGAAGKPFWITEVGWPTCRQSGSVCVSQRQQAINLGRLFTDVRGMWRNWVQAVFVYRYGDGADPTTVQDAYGLTTLSGAPKPALAVFRRQAAIGSAGDR